MIVRLNAERPWARLAGYSRAVRAHGVVEVAGTAAADEEGVYGMMDHVTERERGPCRDRTYDTRVKSPLLCH